MERPEPQRPVVSFVPDGPEPVQFKLPESLGDVDKLRSYAASRLRFVVVRTAPDVYRMMLESEAPHIDDPDHPENVLRNGEEPAFTPKPRVTATQPPDWRS